MMITRSVSRKNKIAESSGSGMSEMARSTTHLESQSPDQMFQVPTEMEAQNSDIEWSGDSSICSKQLKHYLAFIRDDTKIAVYSFVFIMSEEESPYLGYLKDMFEDSKGQKMVKVRWFHSNEEVKGVRPQPHPQEVILAPYAQVISAECVNGTATVLTPKHYEQCLALLSEEFSSDIYMCSRKIKNNKVKPFNLSKLHGYSAQTIFLCLDLSVDELMQDIPHEKEEEEDVACHGAKGVQSSGGVVTYLVSDNQAAKREPCHKKLKITLSSKGPDGIELVGSKPQPQVPSFKVGEEMELLSQDSSMRGCWFRCEILKASKKNLKVLYKDVEDVEGPGKLEEWVPADRVAAPDKLGIRCSARYTVRPCPPEDTSHALFSIGAPVDAWWCEGWWEGVVVGINVPHTNGFFVYFPGEDRFKNFQKKNLRTSRDWVENKWVAINPKTDILSFISSDTSANTKLQTCLALAGTSGVGSKPVDHQVLASSHSEAVNEGGQEWVVSPRRQEKWMMLT